MTHIKKRLGVTVLSILEKNRDGGRKFLPQKRRAYYERVPYDCYLYLRLSIQETLQSITI